MIDGRHIIDQRGEGRPEDEKALRRLIGPSWNGKGFAHPVNLALVDLDQIKNSTANFGIDAPTDVYPFPKGNRSG